MKPLQLILVVLITALIFGTDLYHLKRNLFAGNAWLQFEQAVESVLLKRVWDLNDFADYMAKMVDTNVHQNNDYGAIDTAWVS